MEDDNRIGPRRDPPKKGPRTGLRIGIVGGGVMGLHHARALRHRSDVRVVGVVEPNPERRRFLRNEHNLNPVEQLEALLEHCDAAIVACPASHHVTAAQTLLDAGLHVLVEKPLATSLDDARMLFDLADEKRRILMAGHILHHHRVVLQLRSIPQTPRIIRVLRTGTSRRITDVGAVLDLMFHDLDLVQLLLGQAPIAVDMKGMVVEGLEECCNALLTYASGTHAVLTACRMAPARHRLLMIGYEHADIHIHWTRSSNVEVHVRPTSPSSFNPDLPWPAGTSQLIGDDPLVREHDTFLSAIRGETIAHPSPQQVLLSLDTAFTLLQHIRTSDRHVCHSNDIHVPGEIWQ